MIIRALLFFFNQMLRDPQFFLNFRTLNLKEMTRSSKKILILGISNWSQHHFAPISSCATILFSIFIDQMAWQFSIFHTAWQNDKTPAPHLLSTTEEVCWMSLCSLIFEFSQLECINFPQYGISNRGETFEQRRCHLRAGCETWNILSSLFVISAETLSGAQNCAACVSPGLENNDLCCHHHQHFAVLDKADHERFSFISLAHTSWLTSFWPYGFHRTLLIAVH